MGDIFCAAGILGWRLAEYADNLPNDCDPSELDELEGDALVFLSLVAAKCTDDGWKGGAP